MPGAEPLWIDDEAGPLVRPYAMTGGRARPRNGFNVISLVLAMQQAPPLEVGLTPEHLH
ncbi:DUF742 domain-containing protein, partial [Micromonospora fluostatini]